MHHKLNQRESKFFFGLALALILLLLPLLLFPELNQQLFLSINNWGRVVPPLLWAHITFFGDGLFIFAIQALCVLIVRHNYGNQAAYLISIMSCGGIITGLLVQSLKRLFAWERPLMALPYAEINLVGAPFSFHSFPSGHSATIFFFISTLIVYFRLGFDRLLYIYLLFLGAFIVALSRIMVGVHFPADVLAGSGVGLILGWWTIQYMRFLVPPRWLIFSCYGLILVAAVALCFYDSTLPGVAAFQLVCGVLFSICAVLNLWSLRHDLGPPQPELPR